MFKNYIRILFFLIIIIFLFILYLSLFGIKTKQFNKLIKSEIVKLDSRLNVNLEDVFIKLNIKEKSFSINSRDVEIFINNEKQKLRNVNLLIELVSLVRKDNKINKVIINSSENEISNLLKFVRNYKINIPTLYLENSVTKGKIIYDIVINLKEKNFDQIKVLGKIIDAELNILGKEIFKNINLNFNYKNQKLQLINLKFKYKNTNFVSKNISTDIKKNLIEISGDLENKINSNLVLDLFDYDIREYLNETKMLSSKSSFKLILNKKFKIKDYKLHSNINFNDMYLNLKNIELKNYIKGFDNKIILKDGEINLSLDNKSKINVKLNSNYLLDKDDNPKSILFNFSKIKTKENYNLKIELIENEIYFEQFNFLKNKDDKFLLEANASSEKDIYEINNLKFYNDKNKFIFNNIKFTKNFKIQDFKSIEANYLNKDNFTNDILIKKKDKNINIFSNKFDLSTFVEKSLKSTKKNKFLDIFNNLNSLINIDIKLAKIDEEHSLKNLKGSSFIKNNKISKSNISGKFNNNNKFNYTIEYLDGKKVTTIFSDLAKPFVKKFKFIKGFEDGKIDYTSTEINQNLSKSELRIYNFKLQDMPALTKLLSLASLQGIADLATGQGIRFTEFDMFFDNTEELITINEIYALGPAISVLMDGYVAKNNLVSLRGTLVPATTINKTVAKIPLLGEILVGDKMGEGVFGVSFKIKGHPNDLNTRVNPIKTLTPRFITRTLDKIKKTN